MKKKGFMEGIFYGSVLSGAFLWGCVFVPWLYHNILKQPLTDNSYLFAKYIWVIGPFFGGVLGGWISHMMHKWWHGIIIGILSVILAVFALRLFTPLEARMLFLNLIRITDLKSVFYLNLVLSVSAVLGMIGGILGSKIPRHT